MSAPRASNWFDAERKRVKAAQPPAPEGAQEAPAAEGDSSPPAAPAAMRKRKAAGPSYEAPTDDASREALLASLSAEEAALSEALDEPRADLFALLPASQLSAAAQPLLNRAVRGPAAPIRVVAPRSRRHPQGSRPPPKRGVFGRTTRAQSNGSPLRSRAALLLRAGGRAG